MQQRRWHRVRRGREEDRRALYAVHRTRRRLDEHRQRKRGIGEPLAHDPAARRPGGQDGEDDESDEDREPGAFEQLHQSRREENHVDGHEYYKADPALP